MTPVFYGRLLVKKIIRSTAPGFQSLPTNLSATRKSNLYLAFNVSKSCSAILTTNEILQA